MTLLLIKQRQCSLLHPACVRRFRTGLTYGERSDHECLDAISPNEFQQHPFAQSIACGAHIGDSQTLKQGRQNGNTARNNRPAVLRWPSTSNRPDPRLCTVFAQPC